MPEPDLKIVRIVSGSDFNRARSEFNVYVIIRDDRNFPADDRQNKRFAYDIFISRVFGVNRYRSVAEHSFRARRGDDKISVAVLKIISEMPEKRRFFDVFHFRVRKRGSATRTPVNYSLSLINQTFIVKIYENFLNRSRTSVVHRKSEFRPVARRAEPFELLDYSSAVFVFPRPGSFKKSFSADVLFCKSFGFHLIDYFNFGRDRRVVRSRKP